MQRHAIIPALLNQSSSLLYSLGVDTAFRHKTVRLRGGDSEPLRWLYNLQTPRHGFLPGYLHLVGIVVLFKAEGLLAGACPTIQRHVDAYPVREWFLSFVHGIRALALWVNISQKNCINKTAVVNSVPGYYTSLLKEL